MRRRATRASRETTAVPAVRRIPRGKLDRSPQLDTDSKGYHEKRLMRIRRRVRGF